jgi:hypothetical protein
MGVLMEEIVDCWQQERSVSCFEFPEGMGLIHVNMEEMEEEKREEKIMGGGIEVCLKTALCEMCIGQTVFLGVK